MRGHRPDLLRKTVTLSFDESQVASSQIGLINLDCHSSTTSVCGSGASAEHAEGLDRARLFECVAGEPVVRDQDGRKGRTGQTGVRIRAGTGQPLFFPVWDQYSGSGPAYHVIGWAAFVIDAGGVDWGSQTRQLTGHFVTFTATDLASGGTIGGATDFGVHVITLTQ